MIEPPCRIEVAHNTAASGGIERTQGRMKVSTPFAILSAAPGLASSSLGLVASGVRYNRRGDALCETVIARTKLGGEGGDVKGCCLYVAGCELVSMISFVSKASPKFTRNNYCDVASQYPQ